jgi:hypothetical protein
MTTRFPFFQQHDAIMNYGTTCLHMMPNIMGKTIFYRRTLMIKGIEKNDCKNHVEEYNFIKINKMNFDKYKNLIDKWLIE